MLKLNKLLEAVDSSDSPFHYDGFLPLMVFYLHSCKKYSMGTYNENEIKYTHPETNTEFSIHYLTH